jgi:NADH:ubiquinone oxidoreductase subunit H
LYYLGEYLHLFFFSSVLVILLFGGWEIPNYFVVLLVFIYDHNELLTMNPEYYYKLVICYLYTLI